MSPFVQVAWAGSSGSFATLETTSTYTTTDELLTKTLTLPAGISNGDVAIIVFYTAFTEVTHTTPTGWDLEVAGSNAGGGKCSIYSRLCDGTEGTTVDMVMNAGRRANAIMYRFSGAGAVEANLTAGLDPTSLSPAGGSAKTTWITAAMGRRTDYVLSQPANYGNLIVADNYPPDTVNSGYSALYAADRQLEAASEDPATWVSTPANIQSPLAATISVAPA